MYNLQILHLNGPALYAPDDPNNSTAQLKLAATVTPATPRAADNEGVGQMNE